MENATAAREAVARFIAPEIFIVSVGPPPVPTGSTACDPTPFHGGYKISFTTGSSCTLGFAAYAPGNNYYLITAGHCANQGVGFCQPTCGTIYSNAYQASNHPQADAASIWMSSGLTHGSFIITVLRSITGWEGFSGDVVGESDCLSGYASNNPCGTLLDKSYDVTFGGKTFTVMRRVSYASVPGDSGGPHFSGHTIHGIQSGNRNASPVQAFYSHVYDVLASLGIYYVVTSSVRPG